MHDHPLRPRSSEATLAQASWTDGSPEAAALEENASDGCSVCARTLVNARETAVDLALAGTPAKPSGDARRALLERTRGTLAARKTASVPQAAPAKPRAVDPAAVIAHKHLTLPEDAARIAEIDALRATEPGPGDGSARMLSQLARFLDFSIFVVTIVRGERATYRVQLGMPANMSAFRDLRREISYCTHCVSAAAPFTIENAITEPFFRGNKAATRYGMASYAGVPLRTSTGIVIGTLCAMDFAPRTITQETAAVLEVFSRRAVAEIERERTPSLLAAVLERSTDRADLATAAFFRDIVAAELARYGAASPARRTGASALVTMRSSDAATVLAWLDEHETAGRLDETSFAILLPNAGSDAAAARLARLRAVAGDAAVGVSIAPEGPITAADWITSTSR